MDNIETSLSTLQFWDKLTDDERDIVHRNTVLREYEKGQLIHSGEDVCLGMVLLLSGSVRAYLLSEEGREITLFRLQKGDICVLTASCVISQITFETHVSAEKQSLALIISSGAVAELARKNIYARCYLYELATERFSSVMWSMQQILFKGYDRRLAAFLVDEYDRTGVPEIKMTHERIAQLTSSAREVVARMLKRFTSEGLVEYSRGCIRIEDIAALRKMM